MELPVLPLLSGLTAHQMLHRQFDTQSGPLWRAQILTEDQLSLGATGLGPEVCNCL